MTTRIDNLSGANLDGWTLANELGRGADGVVYKCQREGRVAAIKLFFPENLKKSAWSGARERLEMQLALVGKKHHANLVEILDGGEATELETIFLVMELAPGTSLDKLTGRVPSTAIPSLVFQLAAAAQHLETMELVHRDIKPANIVITDDFQHLTLLDLGIMHQLPTDDDQGRLSGMEFVATTRYSPPEFVWRKEQGDVDDAWRAVTFYQIGATLYDMIMGTPIFSGLDTPRACLYDAVRDHTPIIEPTKVDGWLVSIAEACLLKDWRQRLKHVSWESFSEPSSTTDREHQERRLRLRQLRNEEMRQAQMRQPARMAGPTREQQLWQLNNALILEVRTYLIDAQIFPICSVSEEAISGREHATRFFFEADTSRGFQENVIFSINVAIDQGLEDATKLTFTAAIANEVIASASWTEMFNVETALTACQQSFVDAVESLLTMQGQ